MDWLNGINSDNFESSFNITNIVKDSVFYPAAGTDGRAIQGLSKYSRSFVHVDYSVPKETLETALRTHFEPVGYRMIGLKEITEKELTPNGYQPNNYPLQESEKERMHFLNDSIRNFTPFAIWAMYELDDSLTGSTNGKIDKFSVLHIGGEACATFDAIYVGNKMNPLAVAILNPGEGFGDNWTQFRNPDYRFHKLLELNATKFNQVWPKYLYTNMCAADNCFWSNYKDQNSKTWNECHTFENME